EWLEVTEEELRIALTDETVVIGVGDRVVFRVAPGGVVGGDEGRDVGDRDLPVTVDIAGQTCLELEVAGRALAAGHACLKRAGRCGPDVGLRGRVPPRQRLYALPEPQGVSLRPGGARDGWDEVAPVRRPGRRAEDDRMTPAEVLCRDRYADVRGRVRRRHVSR